MPPEARTNFLLLVQRVRADFGLSVLIASRSFDALRDMGVSAIFTPGSPVPEAAIEVIERLNEQLGYAQVEPAR